MRFFFEVALGFLATTSASLFELDSSTNDPIANPLSVITVFGARFTVLTPHLIRAEQTSASSFEDRPTLSTLNRRTTVPEFKSSTKDSILTITTSAVELTYSVGTPFSADTFSVVSKDASSAFSSYTFGQTIPKEQQLPGTIHNLDEQNVDSLFCDETPPGPHDESMHCTMALFSRAGFAVYDDATTPTFGSDGFWAGQNTNSIDVYLYFHGLDYKLALSDYSMIGGKMPLVPRSALGIWFTRWVPYNQQNVDAILNEYMLRNLPMDIFVLDMNWHKKDGWTGYTFDPILFPFGGESLIEMKARTNLKLAANLHDADGVASFEDSYQSMADAIGFDTSSGDTIPFMSCSNQSFAYALEDQVLAPLEEEIFDFWWIDWQQGGTQGGCSGERENPTILTNQLRVTDNKRRGGEKENDRGMVLSRFGGLGNHRYNVGFSGDVDTVTWDTLAYQPYFSSTSANVGFSLWSHDLVGPNSGDDDADELFLRWLQWGAFSGIFRSHERGMSSGACADEANGCHPVHLWDLPQYMFESARTAVRARSQLIPYMYSAIKKSHDSLLAMLRPMYHDYPEYDEAYSACTIDGERSQYMFGNDMFIAPVVSKSDDVTKIADKKIWIPPGQWVDHHGVVLTGPREIKIGVTLDEIPAYKKADSVVATKILGTGEDLLGSALQEFIDLTFTIEATSFMSEGESNVFSDDGLTTDYYTDPEGSTKMMNFKYKFEQGANGVDLKCTFDGMEGMKRVKVVLTKCPMPEQVEGFVFDSQSGSCEFELDESGEASLHFTGNVTPQMMDGWKGTIARSNHAKLVLDAAQLTPGAFTGGQVDEAYLLQLSSLGGQLSHAIKDGNEGYFVAILGGLEELLINTRSELGDVAAANENTEHSGRTRMAQALLDVVFKI